MRRLWFVAALAIAWVNSATAAVFVTWSGTALVSPGVWDWTYSVTLQPDQNWLVGQTATIYDVGSILDLGPFNPTFGPGPGGAGNSFLVSAPGTGPVAILNDDPFIRNVSVQLTGSNILGDPTAGPITIGTIHVRANTPQGVLTDYATTAQFNGQPSTTTGRVLVPVPEPGSVTLLLVGLAAVGGLAYRRRQA
jgi:hypothetical protein